MVRCEHCLLASHACMCRWKVQATIPIEFVLVMHRKEVYKTTNSGRLIADVFPEQTHAFLWDRTEPDPQLLALLNDPQYRSAILFPEESQTPMTAEPQAPADNRPLRIILLDGTWKQASRMVRLSDWLKSLPRISIHPQEQPQPYIRQAIREGQLSTAQAAACLLQQYHLEEASQCLHHYFSVFNQHCIATRRNITPAITQAHRYLEAYQERLRNCVT